LKKGGFTTFAVTLHQIATGLFNQFDGNEHRRVVSHGCRAFLYAADEEAFGLLDEEVLRGVGGLLNSRELRRVLQSVKPGELEEARREIGSLISYVSEIATLGNMITNQLSIAELLTGCVAAEPEMQVHLLLLWLAVRRSEQVRKGYAELITAAQAIRSKKKVTLMDGNLEIID